MKSILPLLFMAAAIIFSVQTHAQNEPDGFASVSGEGLETTTGGAGGKVIYAETISRLSIYANSDNPYIIIIQGTLEPSSFTTIKVGSNTTIVGYGTDATLKNMELQMVNKQNIIIRNLTIRDSYVEGDWEGKTNDNDGVQADNTHHLWIDHCFFTHLGDGLIDLRIACDYVTVSNCKLSNHNKAFGIGWTEETDFHMTIHHCWIDSTNQRNPSFDMGIGHLYNNYLSNISSYGNLSRGKARVVVENSHFYKANDPLKISDTAVLFSSNNKIENCSGNIAGNTLVKPFDPANFYDYELDPVDDVKSIVTAGAGPKQFVSDYYTSTSVKNINNKSRDVNYVMHPKKHSIAIETLHSTNLKVSIYSILGELVFSKNMEVNGTENIDLGNHQSGVYLLRIETPTQTIADKFCLN